MGIRRVWSILSALKMKKKVIMFSNKVINLLSQTLLWMILLRLEMFW